MNLEEMKAMAMRLPVELSKGNLKVLDEVVASDAVDHSVPPGMPPTVEGTKMFLGGMRAAFPDLTFKVEDTVAEGDKVFQRVTGHGTMKGDFMGMKASGKSATWTEMHVVRFKGDKVAEHWAVVDMASMLTQLGFMPGPH